MLESSEDDDSSHQTLASKIFNFLNKHKKKIAIGLTAAALSNRKHIKNYAINHGLLKKPIGMKIKDALRAGAKTMAKHPKLSTIAAGAAVTGVHSLLKNTNSRITVLDEPPSNDSKVSTSVYDIPNIHNNHTVTKTPKYKPTFKAAPAPSVISPKSSDKSSTSEKNITDQFRQVHKDFQSQLRDGISKINKQNTWI